MDFTLKPPSPNFSPANSYSAADDNDYSGKFRIVEIASFRFTSSVQHQLRSHLDGIARHRVYQKKTNHNGFLLSSVCASLSRVNMLKSSFNLTLNFYYSLATFKPIVTLQIISKGSFNVIFHSIKCLFPLWREIENVVDCESWKKIL